MNNRPRIYVTSSFHAPAMELLGGCCVTDAYGGATNVSREEVLARVADKDGLICLIANKVDAELMDAGRGLRVILTASVGYNHVDVAEATKRGIYVCNSPSGPVEATADMAFGLLLAAARRIVEADKYFRAGKWKEVTPMILLGAPVAERTIGIVGFGQIGRAVARRARGFAMKVLYTDVTRAPQQVEKELDAEYRTLEALLQQSDFVSVHTPVTPETVHLIDEKTLSLMKPTAILINTSRGPMVDEAALFIALKEKRILGAALDVHEQEPSGPGDPLLVLDNVILLPHIGSSTEETRIKTELAAAESLIAVLKGERPRGWLNPDVEKIRPLDQVKML
jgi:glyoxylate reductase